MALYIFPRGVITVADQCGNKATHCWVVLTIQKLVDNAQQCFAYKVEIFLEQREVAFLSPSKICENLNLSTEIQIFVNFAW